jgi:rod shape-determining protein MreC
VSPRLNLDKFKKKSVIFSLSFVILLIFLSCLIPPLRAPLLNTIKFPLTVLTLIKQEIGGIIFYHHNMVQSKRSGKEIDLLKQSLNNANEIILENARLNNLLSLKQKSSYKLVAARVIGRSPDSWSSVIIIDKGRHSGIRPGMVVINYLGLVGRVTESAESTSKITLLNDPNIGVSCVAQRSRQEGLVSGTLGNDLIMKYLPKDADINVSDIIVTSGLTEAYPKGLLIGKVVYVGDELSGLTRYCLVRPAVNLSSIEEILIIIQ